MVGERREEIDVGPPSGHVAAPISVALLRLHAIVLVDCVTVCRLATLPGWSLVESARSSMRRHAPSRWVLDEVLRLCQ